MLSASVGNHQQALQAQEAGSLGQTEGESSARK